MRRISIGIKIGKTWKPKNWMDEKNQTITRHQERSSKQWQELISHGEKETWWTVVKLVSLVHCKRLFMNFYSCFCSNFALGLEDSGINPFWFCVCGCYGRFITHVWHVGTVSRSVSADQCGASQCMCGKVGFSHVASFASVTTEISWTWNITGGMRERSHRKFCWGDISVAKTICVSHISRLSAP